LDVDCRPVLGERQEPRRQRMCAICDAIGKRMPRSFTTQKCRLDVCRDHMLAIIDGRINEVGWARTIQELAC
jgi:hypothetical protein